jgi:hypothetical protein
MTIPTERTTITNTREKTMTRFDQIKDGELFFDGFRVMEKVPVVGVANKFNFNAVDGIYSRFEWVRNDSYVIRFDGNWDKAAEWDCDRGKKVKAV